MLLLLPLLLVGGLYSSSFTAFWSSSSSRSGSSASSRSSRSWGMTGGKPGSCRNSGTWDTGQRMGDSGDTHVLVPSSLLAAALQELLKTLQRPLPIVVNDLLGVAGSSPSAGLLGPPMHTHPSGLAYPARSAHRPAWAGGEEFERGEAVNFYSLHLIGC